MPMKLDTLCRDIELILSDVDGVLTDGGIFFDNQGIESKKFHVRDGLGINLWRKAGYQFGILTSRNSHIVKVRAAELGIGIVRQGSEDKLGKALEVIAECGLKPEQVCFIGDDLPDLPIMKRAGLGVAVADAPRELREAAHYTTRLAGGQGAVREVVELVLRHKQQWDDLIQKYTAT